MTHDDLRLLASEMERELREDIIPFWSRYVDGEHGGFYGLVGNDGLPDVNADKGLVSQARFLWSYSAFARFLDAPAHMATAEAAYRFLKDRLYDREGKGFFWSTDRQGRPKDARKVVYGQAFAIYALSEYARAGGPSEALDLAFETFHLLQRAALDAKRGGYFEAVTPDWSGPVSSVLSDVDVPCAKSMNTNLHVLEALSSLYAASGDDEVRAAIEDLIRVHLDKILVTPEHLGLYFDADWARLDATVSYGHDIESSWLIAEAAEHAWPGRLPEEVRGRVLAVAAGCARTLQENGGSLPYERKDGTLETDRIWWPQAETVIGMVNAWELGGNAAYLRHARGVWDFIKSAIIDREHGEWFWGVRTDGSPLADRPKGGFWKGCYHNGRACMEVMARARRARIGKE